MSPSEPRNVTVFVFDPDAAAVRAPVHRDLVAQNAEQRPVVDLVYQRVGAALSFDLHADEPQRPVRGLKVRLTVCEEAPWCIVAALAAVRSAYSRAGRVLPEGRLRVDVEPA